MKNILAFSLCVFLLAAAACAGEAAPTETASVETTLPPSISNTTVPAPSETVPSGYVSYSNQGWLLVTWTMSSLRAEPAIPQAGKPVDIWANIYIADFPMSYIRVELIVNGKVVDTKQLVLWFDDPQDFSLSFLPDAPGLYDISVRANMMENEEYSLSSGEDLGIYSSMSLNVV
jgi:hypothetical protein